MIKMLFGITYGKCCWRKFLADTGNKYLLIGQAMFKGKDDESVRLFCHGVKVAFKIMEDNSKLYSISRQEKKRK